MPCMEQPANSEPEVAKTLLAAEASSNTPNEISETKLSSPDAPPPAAAAAGPLITFTRGGQVLHLAEGYKLIKCLGRGGFGEVWSAEAPGGVEAAIKVITRPLQD